MATSQTPNEREDMTNKTILVPIDVPSGDYCVNEIGNYNICQFYDNEGGHPTCECDHMFAGYDSLNYDDKGQVKKLPQCLQLSGKRK